MSLARVRLSQVVGGLMLAVVLLGGVALIVVPKAAGATPLTVLSGSMTGTYDVGDVVIVRPVDAEELAVGEVITFQAVSDDPTLTTHRITSISYGSEGTLFTTQGDANGSVDPAPVREEQIRGEVWYHVPVVGHASVWLAGEWGRTARKAVALGLLGYGLVLVGRGALQRRRSRRERAEDRTLVDGASVNG